MKSDKYQRRFYRDWVTAGDLHLMHIMDKETDLQVLTDKPVEQDFLKERIREYRWEIEDYIVKDRRFLTALKPLVVELSAPSIIKEMAQAATKANVGPMAAVAGAIAQFLGRDLLKQGFKDIIIENGGDIFLKTSKRRTIGMYTGKSKIWRGLGLEIKPQDTPLGVCTSSGTIGHSLSFGCADAVVILSKNASLADAAATATANQVKSPRDLQTALNFARSIKGICGAVIILGNNLTSWGKVEFTKS